MDFSKRTLEWVVKIVAIYVAVYHLSFVSGLFPALHIYILSQQHRAMSLGSILVLTFLISPPLKAKTNKPTSWYNLLFILAAAVPCGYVFFWYDLVVLHQGLGAANNFEIVLAFALTVSLLEATRRTVGLGMALVAIALIFHMLLCNFLPGMFHGRGYSLDRVAYQLLLTNEGIFGIPMGVASTIIITFIIFGQCFQNFGGGKFVSDLSTALLGRYTGGVAKVAVLASAVIGTITGSTAANIATTGTFTIPMMKKSGYTPEFAAAVEAVSSNGGQIMPPVMGAVAFIIAEWIGLPYTQICVAAIIPAILYFAVEFIQIDLEARKTGLRGLPPDQIPSLMDVVKGGWFHVIPFLVLVFSLVIVGYTPEKSCLYALFSLIVVALFNKKNRFSLNKLLDGLTSGAKASPAAVIACGTAGIIICSVLLTGFGFKLSSLITAIGTENMLLLSILAAFSCFILGMGVGSIGGYIIVALLIAPAMIKAGVSPIAAHLFVFYFSLTGFITPPVAVGAFIAAAIARANPWRTGLTSMKLGIITYIVPFLFVSNSALLMQGTATNILLAVVISVVASLALGIGISGFFNGDLSWPCRILVIIGALLMAGSLMKTDSIWILPIGILIAAAGLLRNLRGSPHGVREG